MNVPRTVKGSLNISSNGQREALITAVDNSVEKWACIEPRADRCSPSETLYKILPTYKGLIILVFRESSLFSRKLGKCTTIVIFYVKNRYCPERTATALLVNRERVMGGSARYPLTFGVMTTPA